MNHLASIRNGTAALLLLLPTLASAAGIEYPDNGTLSIGRGGAWAANPSDGLAMQYNPAGFAQQRGWNATIDVRAAMQQTGFTSTSLSGPSISNSGGPFPGPSAALSYGMGQVGPFSELTFAVGATGPSAIGKSKYPSDGAQRYALRSTDYFIAYYSASVAAAIGDKLRFGITAQAVHGSAKFDQAVWSGMGCLDSKNQTADATTGECTTKAGATAKDPGTSFDAVGTFEGSNSITPAAVIGVTFLPIPELAIGASYRTGVHFDAVGTLTNQLPASAANAGISVQGNSADLTLDFAPTARLGALWKATERLEVELDGVWEGWSALKDIIIHTHNINIMYNNAPTALPDVVLPHHFKDSYSARLGADYVALPDRLKVRAGYLFETSAVPPQYASVDFGNWQRNAVSVGGSVRLYGMWLDLAYAHHFLATQTVTDSQVKAIVSPTTLWQSNTSVVGNGTYTASLDVLSLSLRIPFGSVGGGL